MRITRILSDINKRIMALLAVTILSWTVAGMADATLVTIGQATYNNCIFNLIHDKESSQTWLDYTNEGTWNEVNSWAAGLNNLGVLTYTLNAGFNDIIWSSDWRLPSGDDYRHLFEAELGNYTSINSPIFLGDFTNVQALTYWTNVGCSSMGLFFDSFFNLIIADPSEDPWGNPTIYSGLAVRTGQVVAATPVPEPSTLILFSVSLAGVAFFRKSKSRRYFR